MTKNENEKINQNNDKNDGDSKIQNKDLETCKHI